VWPIFGPEVKTFGEVDARLRRLTIERTTTGAVVKGEAVVADGDAMQAPHVLTQRLQQADSVAAPRVDQSGTGAHGAKFAFSAEAKVAK
jgi:hypothetical protein